MYTVISWLPKKSSDQDLYLLLLFLPGTCGKNYTLQYKYIQQEMWKIHKEANFPYTNVHKKLNNAIS